MAATEFKSTAAFLILSADVVGQFASFGLVAYKEVLSIDTEIEWRKMHPHLNPGKDNRKVRTEIHDFYLRLINPIAYGVLGGMYSFIKI